MPEDGVVKNVKRQAWCLSKYPSKEDFERYQSSGGWVFGGWIGFSQWVRKEFGHYPKRDVLVKLARMGEPERDEDTVFGAYLRERKGRRSSVM